MKLSLLSLFLMVLLTHATSKSFAQSLPSANDVTGILTDEHGKPMEYATVSLIRLTDSNVVKGTLSDERGIYSLGIIKPGNYAVAATSIGFDKAMSQPFTLTGSQTGFSVPAIAMHSTGNSLGAVVITASTPFIEQRPDMTVMNVSNSVLATGNSAYEILARAPGVTFDHDDNISLRGKKGVTLMINDKLTYLSAAQLATLLRSTDGTTIQSIEIITNPSAKYDASGSAGIINIKLKKSKQSGSNGSITAGEGYGYSWKNDETLMLNHKEGNINVYGSFSHLDGKYDHQLQINRIVADSPGNENYFKQTSMSPSTSHDNNYRIGLDYDISNNNTLGIMTNGYHYNVREDITSLTNIGTSPNEKNAYLNTISRINYTYNNVALNLYDKIKLDTMGQSLTVDLDYSRFNNSQNSEHNTAYFNPDGSTGMPSNILRQQSPSIILIHTAKADYSYLFNAKIKLETGAKFSDVKTDNDLSAQQQVNGSYENDSALTNRFIYSEKIIAAYVNLTKSFKSTTIEMGLRGEYTASNGNLITKNNVVKRSYFDLFPSLFFNHTIDNKNSLGFSYSRRIDRPAYDNLNPFIYYIDQYTYGKGNPFLNPQYTHSFELNYSYNKILNLSLNYSHTSNRMTTVLLTDPATEATYQTVINLQSENAYTVNINAPIRISNWWNVNADVNCFYSAFKSDTLLGAAFNRGKIAYQAKLMHTFRLSESIKAEVMNSYASSLYEGIFLLKRIYSNDAGISYAFSSHHANIKLSMSDIFNTLRNHIISDYQINNIDLKQKRETRIVRLTFTYNFGGDQIKLRSHATGADDVSGRVKGNN